MATALDGSRTRGGLGKPDRSRCPESAQCPAYGAPRFASAASSATTRGPLLCDRRGAAQSASALPARSASRRPWCTRQRRASPRASDLREDRRDHSRCRPLCAGCYRLSGFVTDSWSVRQQPGRRASGQRVRLPRTVALPRPLSPPRRLPRREVQARHYLEGPGLPVRRVVLAAVAVPADPASLAPSAGADLPPAARVVAATAGRPIRSPRTTNSFAACSGPSTEPQRERTLEGRTPPRYQDVFGDC